MSASAELQKLVFDTLVADAGVGALVGDAIYDGRPEDGAFPCITFGPSDHFPTYGRDVEGRVETLQVDCWSRAQGRLWPVRQIADAVKAALHATDLSLTTNALVTLDVTGVRAFMDPDGVTAHGVVTIEAEIEEA